MAYNGKIGTGQIIPRDYGIVLQRPRSQRMFLSPSKYALAAWMVMSPQRRYEAIDRYAQEVGAASRELDIELAQAIQKKEGSDVLVRLAGREQIRKVSRYRSAVSASVRSKKDADADYHPHLWAYQEMQPGRPPYRGARCDCAESHWATVKPAIAMCPHAATLETALYIDNVSRSAQDETLTGLFPRDRPRAISPPFRLVSGSRSAIGRGMVEMLTAYYLEGRSHYDINREYTHDKSIRSDWLSSMLSSGSDDAQFMVMRHGERMLDPANLSYEQKRLLGSVNNVQRQVRAMLKKSGFSFDGYAVERVSSDEEVIAHRFRQRDVAYTLCIGENQLPLIIKRHLGDKVAEEQMLGQQLTARGFGEDNGEPYLSVDPVTCRESMTRTILPGFRHDSEVRISNVLREAYQSALQQL
ncbi:MAG: hypothetical protein ACOCWQ_00915 [Nanoarchaeota archaeon]